MNTPRSHRIRMLLSILAKKLRTGNINVFNKVLNEIQLYKKDADIREMVNNMQAMFEALDQDKSKGTYVRICGCLYLHYILKKDIVAVKGTEASNIIHGIKGFDIN